MLLGHSCGCRCVSGTFVMVFCAARRQPRTNRGDPPPPAINRWMSEGSWVGTRISLPPFQEEKKKKHARFSPAAAQSGTEGERRASARKRRLFVLEHVFAGDAQTLPDKRGARSACAPPLPPVCSAVAASLLWNKRAHSYLFFILFLLIAHALTSVRLKPEQRRHICGLKVLAQTRLSSFPPSSLSLSLSLSWQRYVTVRLRGQTERKWLM